MVSRASRIALVSAITESWLVKCPRHSASNIISSLTLLLSYLSMHMYPSPPFPRTDPQNIELSLARGSMSICLIITKATPCSSLYWYKQMPWWINLLHSSFVVKAKTATKTEMWAWKGSFTTYEVHCCSHLLDYCDGRLQLYLPQNNIQCWKTSSMVYAVVLDGDQLTVQDDEKVDSYRLLRHCHSLGCCRLELICPNSYSIL